MHGNWFALYREDGPDLLAVGAREAACWVKPGKTDWSTGSTWPKPARRWNFNCAGLSANGCHRAAEGHGAQAFKRLTPLPQQYVIKYQVICRSDQVKSYVPEWPDRGLPHPRLFATPQELGAFRSRFTVNSNTLARLRQTAPNPESLEDYIACVLATRDPGLQGRLTQFALERLQAGVDLYVRQTAYPTPGAYPHEYYNEVTPALNALDAILQPDMRSAGEPAPRGGTRPSAEEQKRAGPNSPSWATRWRVRRSTLRRGGSRRIRT